MGSISYRKLWHMLLDKKMTKYELQQKSGISSTTMTKMGKGESVTLRTISAICDVLACQPGDILDYVASPWPGDNGNKKNTKSD